MTATPASRGGWTARADGDLPMAGAFYGHPLNALQAQNAAIAVESSRRFRAERTGAIEAVRFHTRVLTDRDIAKKCAASGSGSQWCDCRDGGLDAYTCGYSTGSAYSVGNGGLIHVELRRDDGRGEPGERVLGRTPSIVPMEEFGGDNATYTTLRFESPAPIELGETYHLLFRNLNPPVGCALSGEPVSKAASCPRDQGAIGLNGLKVSTTASRTGVHGPWLGDTDANLYRRTVDGPWRLYEKALSYFELTYSDGVKVGESYHAVDATSGGVRKVGGDVRARQSFTVRDASRQVDGVWLAFGHPSAGAAAPLDVVLRDASGTTLARGTMPASDLCVAELRTGEKRCRDWQYASFGESVDLLEGSSYSVEFASKVPRSHLMISLQPLSRHGFDDRNHWSDARAEISTNGGSSWGAWKSDMADERDMPVLFTIEGMPRSLP